MILNPIEIQSLFGAVTSRLDVVGLAVDATPTVWTPNPNESFILLQASIKLRAITGTVTTRPKGQLLCNSIYISRAITLPIVLNDAIELPLLKGNNSASVAVINTGDLITMPGSGLQLGDPVSFSGTAGSTGITMGTVYYAIPSASDTTKFQIADTYAHAIAGTAVVLGADQASDGTIVGYTGATSSRVTHSKPLKFKLVLDQVGATVLLYELFVVGVRISDVHA